ncbi:TetR/AcrR family transcriptional regulator [Ktedonosporobacter rubrisoli]|uniref:TetR/AcrR family transcriptional regulator n=1 Tax=Ktedonosporobacter rubrisoli TaxID=2509675 RepID=A0A4P6JWR4_KTERU|nr:TetR/AcrR family transcriptional regulator [Ktedonosporobacter rubrisoli]QBD80167.1 TetR/AcrR family transcriptional regulator [Ktedonosporobacter rubrisoli]
MSRADTASERRTEIIAATIRVLARDGLAQTTTRKIAAEAGVNQATLRYYFGSKDDLLFAVLQEMMKLTGEIARRARAGSSGSIREIIADSLIAFWSSVEESPELQIIQYELTLYALRHPASSWLARQQYDGYCAVVESLIQEAFAAANLTCAIPVADLARFIVGGLDGIILQFISDRNTVRSRRDIDHLTSAVIALAEGAPSSHRES